MRMFRVATAVVAVGALSLISACKESSTGPGDITCAASDPVCPPGDLVLGFTGATGAPTIVPGGGAGTTLTLSASSYVLTGTTSSTLPGYWLLVTDGTLSSWGVIVVGGSVYSAEVPLFCGDQRLIYTFSNAAGRSYYAVSVNRTGCTGPSAFRVQLTWTSDPNSDLDLHLLRPGGSYGTGDDCYFGNCPGSGLEWGVTGTAGNPILDVDDTDGFGPENIYLTSGAEAGEYRIIIHNWDGTDGEVATVRIYLNDSEQRRYVSSPLNATTARYWEVAKVNVTTGLITAVGSYSSTPPVTLGAPPAWEPIVK